MKKTLAKLVTTLFLATASNCTIHTPQRSVEKSEQQSRQIDIKDGDELRSLQEAMREQIAGTYCLRVTASYNGFPDTVHGGTAFAYQKKEGKTYLATAKHVTDKPDAIYILKENGESLPEELLKEIEKLRQGLAGNKALEDLLERRIAVFPRTGIKYELVDNLADDDPSDDIEVVLERESPDFDAAVLSTMTQIPYLEGLSLGKKEDVAPTNIYVLGFANGLKLYFGACLSSSYQDENHDRAFCYIEPGMSGGQVIAYLGGEFHLIGITNSLRRIPDGEKTIFTRHMDMLFYAPTEKIGSFLYPEGK